MKVSEILDAVDQFLDRPITLEGFLRLQAGKTGFSYISSSASNLRGLSSVVKIDFPNDSLGNELLRFIEREFRDRRGPIHYLYSGVTGILSTDDGSAFLATLKEVSQVVIHYERYSKYLRRGGVSFSDINLSIPSVINVSALLEQREKLIGSTVRVEGKLVGHKTVEKDGYKLPVFCLAALGDRRVLDENVIYIIPVDFIEDLDTALKPKIGGYPYVEQTHIIGKVLRPDVGNFPLAIEPDQLAIKEHNAIQLWIRK